MDKSIQELSSLFERFADNPYITTNILIYIRHTRPNLINTLHKQQIEKESKKVTFNEAVQEISQLYLNKYYYIPSNELFVSYDETNFSITDEDDVQYDLLKYLGENKQYTDMKHKINQQVIKNIKDNNLNIAIPESDTIQSVISLFYPTLFSTKHEAQYFLTIVGDNIQKKETNIIHFVNIALKNVVSIISDNLHNILGSNIQTVKSRFHDHNYNDCRLIKSNNIEFNHQCLKNQYLNIIAVACHYSQRYRCSDTFVKTKITDNDLKNYIFYLKDRTPSVIVDEFICSMLSIKNNANSDNKINNKSISYLWKLFLEKNKLPSVMFMNTLKNELISKLEYDSKSDSFIGVSSPFLPFISCFINFWNDEVKIVHDPLESYDYELDELTSLFKIHCDEHNITLSINEKNILNAIHNYFPDVSIISNKYITNITCKKWDKITEIRDIMEIFKDHTKEANEIKSYSINSLYKFYCKHADKSLPTASKSFFEKFIKDSYYDHINNNIMSSSWFE